MMTVLTLWAQWTVFSTYTHSEWYTYWLVGVMAGQGAPSLQHCEEEGDLPPDHGLGDVGDEALGNDGDLAPVQLRDIVTGVEEHGGLHGGVGRDHQHGGGHRAHQLHVGGEAVQVVDWEGLLVGEDQGHVLVLVVGQQYRDPVRKPILSMINYTNKLELSCAKLRKAGFS